MMRTKRLFWMLLTAAFLGVLFVFWILTGTPSGPRVTEAAPAQVGQTCRTYTSRDVPKTIPDNVVTYTLSKLDIPLSGRVQAISVTFTISHSFPSDLDIALCAPNGGDCILSDNDLTNTGGTYTVTFSSKPSRTWVDFAAGPPYTGSFPAYGYSRRTMLDFLGLRAAGTWYLAVRDNYAADMGSLRGWNLNLCTAAGTPTPTPTVSIAECFQVYYGNTPVASLPYTINQERMTAGCLPDDYGCTYTLNIISPYGGIISYEGSGSCTNCGLSHGAGSDWVTPVVCGSGGTPPADNSRGFVDPEMTVVHHGSGDMGINLPRIDQETANCGDTYAQLSIDVQGIYCDAWNTPTPNTTPTATPICATATPRPWWDWGMW
jgi:subtilisin-like proprotein convertase family protein